MGMPGMTELLIILAVVMLIFGTTRLRTVGKDLGGAIKDFKTGLSGEDEKEKADAKEDAPAAPKTDAEEKSTE